MHKLFFSRSFFIWKDLPNKGLTQEKTVAHVTLVLDDDKALKAHKRKDRIKHIVQKKWKS